jgi:5-methylthioadenosine/S-adenosylhomocysteine deaminase
MSLTLLCPRWCLLFSERFDSKNGCFAPQVLAAKDTVVGIQDDEIVYVGPELNVPQLNWTRVDLPDHILMPGLVNAHVHSAMTLLRGIADDVPLETWLQDHIWPREGAHVSDDFVFDGTLLAAYEMLKGGTTCCNEAYFFPSAAVRAFDKAGMRAAIGSPILDFPTRYAASPDEYIHRALELNDALQDQPLFKHVLFPHAPYTVSDAVFEKIVMFGNELGLPIHTHLQETANEVAQSQSRFQKSPTQRLAELGVISEQFTAVHSVHADPTDIAMLAHAGASVVHCPSSNMKLGSGAAPIEKMRAAGINVGLGTDGAASNNRLDMWQEMSHAALLASVTSANAGAIPAGDILYMATMGGAKALGWEDEIGAIEVGKQADLIAVNLADLSLQPVYDPLSHLVYSCGREHVTHVWVAGRACVRDGQMLTLDEQDVRRRARVWQGQLQ